MALLNLKPEFKTGITGTKKISNSFDLMKNHKIF